MSAIASPTKSVKSRSQAYERPADEGPVLTPQKLPRREDTQGLKLLVQNHISDSDKLYCKRSRIVKSHGFNTSYQNDTAHTSKSVPLEKVALFGDSSNKDAKR